MSTLSTEQLEDLIAQGEGRRIDFKHSIGSSTKIAKAICAFANSSGGKLLIGVKDNGRVAKINLDEESYMIEHALTKIKPELEVEMEQVELDGRNVLVVDTPAGKNLPYFAKSEEGKWLAYVRVNDSNVLANWVWLQIAKKNKLQKSSKIIYSGTEEKAIKILGSGEPLTQSQLAKAINLNWRKTGVLLVKLVSMGIVELHLTKEGATYKTSVN